MYFCKPSEILEQNFRQLNSKRFASLSQTNIESPYKMHLRAQSVHSILKVWSLNLLFQEMPGVALKMPRLTELGTFKVDPMILQLCNLTSLVILTHP